MKKFTLVITIFVFLALVGCSQNTEDDILTPATTAEEILNSLSNLQYSIKGDQISKDEYAWMEDFGQSFVNLYTGAVAEQQTVSFENYIANENLLAFTNKMLALEQQQELKGGIGVIFSLENDFEEVEINKLDDNLYYLHLTFSNQGSGMSCKLLVQSVNKSLRIVDLYFGNKDGVDTIATGHPSERKLDNPKIWDDQEWVDGVMKKLDQIEK
ncbi:hypothetical protein D3C75_867050 [compost metagenome]